MMTKRRRILVSEASFLLLPSINYLALVVIDFIKTGNEGVNVDRFYNAAAIIMWMNVDHELLLSTFNAHSKSTRTPQTSLPLPSTSSSSPSSTATSSSSLLSKRSAPSASSTTSSGSLLLQSDNGQAKRARIPPPTSSSTPTFSASSAAANRSNSTSNNGRIIDLTLDDSD
jgi:hypothetical protein